LKTDAVFKRAFNDALGVLAKVRPGGPLPSESALAARLKVSRTTVRKVLSLLADRRYIDGQGRQRFVTAGAELPEPFPVAETEPTSVQLEKRFMDWMLRADTRPGASISEFQLSRKFGVATGGMREFLNRFQRFGLIEKRPNASWVFKGFTTKFALELFEIREMFELRSALAFADLPKGSPLWGEIRSLREEHLELLDEIDERFNDFSDLDSRFHRLINAAAPNRFVDSFYDIITLIFHYHYQWNKRSERHRNEVALNEHLAYIDALLRQDDRAIERACRAHLTSARETLLRASSE
jgi:DNA-binding GntR family transcriptional regulator